MLVLDRFDSDTQSKHKTKQNKTKQNKMTTTIAPLVVVARRSRLEKNPNSPAPNTTPLLLLPSTLSNFMPVRGERRGRGRATLEEGSGERRKDDVIDMCSHVL
jgi:hypothetical protein